jgi:hypothetical protein
VDRLLFESLVMKIKMLNRHFLLPISLSVGMYLIVSSAYGKTDIVSCEYKYVLGDNDTKHDVRRPAHSSRPNSSEGAPSQALAGMQITPM